MKVKDRDVTYRTRRRSRRDEDATIAATAAAKNFGRLVDRVREERATYVIERGGTPVARIGPLDTSMSTMADLKALIATSPHVDETYLRAVERAVRRHNTPRVRRNPWEQ